MANRQISLKLPGDSTLLYTSDLSKIDSGVEYVGPNGQTSEIHKLSEAFELVRYESGPVWLVNLSSAQKCLLSSHHYSIWLSPNRAKLTILENKQLLHTDFETVWSRQLAYQEWSDIELEADLYSSETARSSWERLSKLSVGEATALHFVGTD